ncbi:MAG: hypothetical protein O3A37_03425 [Planctomycetota bacterium]|nr:hypothetical protein [Planctomycetota bacterium]
MTDKSILSCAIVALLAALVGSATVAGVIQKQRNDLNLVVKMEGVEGMPPHVAVVTAALGTFRGLAVDILWARADHLQMEGEFYEAQTLAQWITTLQPRFPKVWWFQSWNMAWNITAATQVPAERWGWVSRGIDLLRSRGIPLNPQAANLYFDLSWIFQNKIGRVGDKEHWYYKARLAGDMQEVLGELVGGRTTQQAIERFLRISDAPATFEELEAKKPEIRQAIDFLASYGAGPDEATLRMLGRVMMRLASLDAKVMGDLPLPRGTNTELVRAMQKDREMATLILEDLVPHLQRRVLQDHYHMDPARMLAAMERYGPLDWRHPDAHGIYWSEEGVAVSRKLSRKEDVNELMLVRGRLLMLLSLMRSGKVEYDPVTSRVDLLPDPRFARKFEEAIEEAFALILSEEGVAAGEFGDAEESDLFATYEKFLNLATMLAYLYGDEAEAERYFVLLKDFMERQGYGDLPAFTGTLENFVAMRFAGMVEVNLGDLRQLLDAMIRRALLEGLAKGDMKTFNRFLKLARSVYDKRYGAADRGQAFVLEEARLPAFPKLLENSFENVMKQAGLPILTRARVWSWAPDTLRRATYKALAETLNAEATAAGLDPLKAFPAPEDSKDSVPSKSAGVEGFEANADEPR